MSAPPVSVPGSVQRKLKEDSTEHDVATLAYALWQERGAPSDGSAEEDWMEAERRLHRHEASTLTRR